MVVSWEEDTGASLRGSPIGQIWENLNIKIIILMGYNPLDKMGT